MKKKLNQNENQAMSVKKNLNKKFLKQISLKKLQIRGVDDCFSLLYFYI